MLCFENFTITIMMFYCISYKCNWTQLNQIHATQHNMHLSIVCILQHNSPPKSVFRVLFVLEAMAGWDNFTHLIKILLNSKPLPNRLKRNMCALPGTLCSLYHLLKSTSLMRITFYTCESVVSVICKLSRRRKINRLKIQFYQIYLPRWKQLEWTWVE